MTESQVSLGTSIRGVYYTLLVMIVVLPNVNKKVTGISEPIFSIVRFNRFSPRSRVSMYFEKLCECCSSAHGECNYSTPTASGTTMAVWQRE